MIGEAEVIVGGKVEQCFAVDFEARGLRRIHAAQFAIKPCSRISSRRRLSSAVKSFTSGRRDGPLSVNHAGGDVAAMLDDGVVGVGVFPAKGMAMRSAKASGESSPTWPFMPERARAVDGGHLQDGFGRRAPGERRRAARISSNRLSSTVCLRGLIDAGEAVGAEADVDAGGGEFFAAGNGRAENKRGCAGNGRR